MPSAPTSKAFTDFDFGIEKASRALLVSPDFLFRIEQDRPGSAPGSVYRISDLELASRKGQTAPMWAAAEGHPEVVQVLIERKADIQAASKSGITALVFAAIRNDAKSVRLLLAAGADANFALPDGTKILLVAAAHKSTLAAGALADGGTNPNVAIAVAIHRCTPPRRRATYHW